MKKQSKYIIPIFVSHRGCPNDCVFCNQRKITGIDSKLGKEEVDSIITEYFQTIPADAKDIEVAFFGGSFSGIDREQQIDLLEGVKQSSYRHRIGNIRISTRPDYIDDDIVLFLKENGVTIIELGVQSMVQNVLDTSKRGHNVEDVYNAVKIIKNNNIILGLQMMIGLPKDNLFNTLYTASKIASLRPDFVRIYPALVIRNTELEQMFYKNQYTPLDVKTAVEHTLLALSIFEENKIRVIRIGLQASEGISLGVDVVGGPFHEAFRELVEGKIAYASIYKFLKQHLDQIPTNNIEFLVNKRYVSCLVGHKKENIKNIRDLFKNLNISITTSDNIDYGNIVAVINNQQTILSREAVLKHIFLAAQDILKNYT